MTIGRLYFELRVIFPRNLQLRQLVTSRRHKFQIAVVTAVMFFKHVVPAFRNRPMSVTLDAWGKMWIDDWSELRVVHEIFCYRIYDVPGLPDEAETVLDLGANGGLATLFFRARYPNAKIVAYEADPEVAGRARRNLKGLPNVTVKDLAVSDRDGVVTFRRQPGKSWSTSMVSNTGQPFDVRAMSLDSILDDIGGATVLKMDIEGAEYAVIRASRKLKSVDFIIGEVHPVPGTSTDEFFDLLEGFELLDKQIEPSGKGVFLARRRS